MEGTRLNGKIMGQPVRSVGGITKVTGRVGYAADVPKRRTVQRSRSRWAWSALLIFLLVPGVARPQTLTGAGATFPAPLYLKWSDAAKSALGLTVHYDAVGSGAGVDRIVKGSVDFGASDTPLPADKLGATNLFQFPTVIGAVVIIVNLPRLRDGQLRLSGEALADIYAGRIKKWNDPQIVKLNPAVTMPNIPIDPVHRYEDSGTTAVFTSYLSAVSPAWRAGPGIGQHVDWPAGPGARGSDGVASAVLNIRGGIGYVEYSFATPNHLAMARLANQHGDFIVPETASFAAAAAAGDWTAPGFAADLINTNNPASWPIVTCTFVLVPRQPPDAKRSADVLRFFDWAFRDGDALAQQLDYIPLPASVRDRIRASWRKAFPQ
jgi:phosphate transport system substrate-binding protein